MDANHRFIVVSGEEATVIRWPAGIVVLAGEDNAVRSAVRVLRGDGEAAPASGLLIERLRMLRLDDFAAGVSTPGGVRLLRSGRGRTDVGSDLAAATHDGAGVAESEVEATATPIWIGIGGLEPAVAERATANSALDLERGAVPGRGVVLTLPVATPIDPRAERPSERFQLVDLTLDPEQPPADALAIQRPVPVDGHATPAHGGDHPTDGAADSGLDDSSSAGSDIVLGIRCSRDHHNNPVAAYCQVCGISMVHLTHNLVPGPRPTLGFLVFDDGATFALDRSYLVGREPQPEPESSLAPLTADDGEHTVSRAHAELVLDGWDLTVADLGSTNGTFVWSSERREWERVQPNRPAVVEPGASVAVGRKTFVYEPVARAV